MSRRAGWPWHQSRSRNGGKTHHPDLLVRRHDAARRRRGAARLPRRAGDDRTPALPRRARAVPRRCRERRRRSRRLHAGGAAVLRGRRRARPARSAFVNVRETAGWSTDAAEAGPKMAALIAAAAEPLPEIPYVSLKSEGVTLIYGRDERAIEAGKLLEDHLDVTVLITRAEGSDAAARHRFSGGARARSASAKGHLGAFELVVDDYAAPAPSSRGALDLRRRRATARCRAATSCSICPAARRCFPRRSARRLSARRSGRSRRRAARRAQGARSRRHLRQAALHHLHRGSVRAFALADRRLPPLPRSLPDRRDRAGRRSRGDRCENLRRLRPMRRRLPDRRRRLRAAARRRADAQAARAAHRLSRGRRRAPGRAAA